ncbi:hypothetical protein DL1_08520 [Thioclava dalianensis]|uniref:Uncharacterized protein n=1 Tax=Thioclava dalianensis TaxID=1185766 RepID=A0A074TAV9_9RHOB|nr:hypothetical protein [Thioclava dalianensis]KEP68819.1 hypothetical protein DL1_08520 [Thioclava dalianensis]SFN49984.1 hypothetical protein SAMN05216224_10683 [Thioclava dalianensis]
MALLKITEFEAGPVSSGVSISQGETRNKTFFRIGLTEAAQAELFGRKLDPKTDALALTVTDDPKHLHLMGIRLVQRDDPSAIAINDGIKGSVNIRVGTWKPAKGKHPAVSLEIINRAVKDGGFSVKLPEWARPAPNHSITGGSS